jgi:hypothetical protein
MIIVELAFVVTSFAIFLFFIAQHSITLIIKEFIFFLINVFIVKTLNEYDVFKININTFSFSS